MRRVLITGARAPVALDLARSFRAAGWEPHLADSMTPWGARLSGVARGRLHRLPGPRFDFERFAQALSEMVAMLQPALIVPTCEEVFYVVAAAERLGFSERVFAPSSELLGRLHSKVEFAALAADCGVLAPATSRITSRAALHRWRGQSRDLVFKPEFSRFASHTMVRPQPEALEKLAPSPEEPWAVQAFEAGEEICIWSAARSGTVVAFAAYRPLWRLGLSSSFYFETDHDPALLDLARKVAAGTGATGQLSYDVIRRADGAIAPLECNPRAVSGIHLFDGDAGLAQAIAGEAPLQTPRTQARHLASAMWALGAPQAIWRGEWGRFRRDLARSEDVFAAAGERLAPLGSLVDAGRFAMVGLSQRRSASVQSTSDIEWNGQSIP